MANPHPKYLKPKETVTATQRKSLGLGVYVERIRHEHEALPITFKTSDLIEIPRMEPSRSNSDAFLRIASKGVQC